jgi:hypothetical protein
MAQTRSKALVGGATGRRLLRRTKRDVVLDRQLTRCRERDRRNRPRTRQPSPQPDRVAAAPSKVERPAGGSVSATAKRKRWAADAVDL